MHIGPVGVTEIIIILIIVAVIFGPSLFTKLGKRLKKTGDAAKKGIEVGAHEAGKDVNLDNVKKKDVMDSVESFQDKMDEKLTKAEEELDDEERQEKAKERAQKVTSKAVEMVEDVAGKEGEDDEGEKKASDEKKA